MQTHQYLFCTKLLIFSVRVLLLLSPLTPHFLGESPLEETDEFQHYLLVGCMRERQWQIKCT